MYLYSQPIISCLRLQYRKHDKNLCPLLDGMFSFVLLDESVDPPRIIAARDPIGITTLYQGSSSRCPGAVFFASELKCLVDECDEIISFPPGHVYDSRDDSLTRYYTPTWWDGDSDSPDAPAPSRPADLKSIRETLETAVKKRLMSEVPYGVLLSGGLDSSIIAAVAARETERVAQAQVEARQKRLAQAETGFATPPGGSYPEGGGGNSIVKNFRPFLRVTRISLRRNRRCVAPAAFFFDRSRAFSRSPRCPESGALLGHRASRVRVHCSRGLRCHSGCNLPLGNLRCHHCEGKHADVSAQPQDQGHGRQDGLEW